ncbi:MAG TPA: polysaccharide deacetylase family protein [Bacteriovoracaceae bacterium]|nr:polysaccharide deacetylase family protein [Bacteriovoracaceae bacterium]
MKIILMSLLFSLSSFASVFQDEQYPEDRTYDLNDRGLSPYRALSLYKSGTFTLTFDDGPHLIRTAIILDTLKKHNVKAIFFVLTDHINQDNDFLIKRMLDEGHLIGCHSPNHDRAGSLTKEQFKSQTAQCFRELADLYKRAGLEFNKPYYRFPYGDYGTRSDYHHINALKEVSSELMGDNCIHMAFWDVDSSDWVPGMTAKEVAQNLIAYNEGGTYIDFKKEGSTYVKVPVTLKNPTGGGVILQHDTQETSAYGLDIFLKYAHDKGLHLPRIDEVEEFKITKNCKL